MERGQLPPVSVYLEAAHARMNELKTLTQQSSFDGLSTL